MSNTDRTDALYVRGIFGPNAVRIPCTIAVQDQGIQAMGDLNYRVVSIVGHSVLPVPTEHPARFGSSCTHQLMVGEIILRPHHVWESNKLQGRGLSGLAKSALIPEPENWERQIIELGVRK